MPFGLASPDDASRMPIQQADRRRDRLRQPAQGCRGAPADYVLGGHGHGSGPMRHWRRQCRVLGRRSRHSILGGVIGGGVHAWVRCRRGAMSAPIRKRRQRGAGRPARSAISVTAISSPRWGRSHPYHYRFRLGRMVRRRRTSCGERAGDRYGGHERSAQRKHEREQHERRDVAGSQQALSGVLRPCAGRSRRHRPATAPQPSTAQSPSRARAPARRRPPSARRRATGRSLRNRIPTVLPRSAPEFARQSQPAKFRFPDHEMERLPDALHSPHDRASCDGVPRL